MPSYFYHLKFELYPTPWPTTDETGGTDRSRDIWFPSGQADVFDDLPSHPHPEQQTPYENPRREHCGHPDIPHRRRGPSSPEADLPDPNVIDCGAPRAPIKEDGRTVERISERQWLERSKSYPPPPASAALRPQTAVRDWRFGRVSIETVDMSMAGEASKGGPAAAPSLGPTTLGGAGAPNKAECVPLKTKNTEVGWGVVHFYREGEETPSLNTREEDDEEAEGGAATSAADCTTLCIPAVPAYMSPGDFLGFVGERWRDDISHCRLVMTSKMNKYLALLKFRNGDRAKKWRREFDGRVFNTMEVSGDLLGLFMSIMLTVSSLKSATPSLCGRSRSKPQNCQTSMLRLRAPRRSSPTA